MITHTSSLPLPLNKLSCPPSPSDRSSQCDRLPFLLPSPIRYETFVAGHMPRRPRPAPREKPSKGKFATNVASSSRVKLPLPKATSERKLKALDPEPESDGEDEESTSDSDEEDSEESDSDDGSLGGDSDEDEEESDVDVDAPRVSQWVDDEDLEEVEVPPGGALHGKAEDIVRVELVSLKSG